MKRFFYHSRLRDGQTLIEAMVALGVLVFGFLGTLSLLSRAFNINRIITDNYLGAYLASEGIEITKNILDHNAMRILGCPAPICSPPISPDVGQVWNAGFQDGDYEIDYSSNSLAPFVGNGRHILYDANTGLYNYSGGEETSYIRKITVRNAPPPDDNPDEIRIVSKVTWYTGAFQGETQLEDRFFNWRKR